LGYKKIRDFDQYVISETIQCVREKLKPYAFDDIIAKSQPI